MYRHLDGALLRAAVRTVRPTIPWPDLNSDSDAQRWRQWLVDAWSEPVAAAVNLASPVLARRIREVCDGHEHEPRQVRSMVLSLTRYLLRMTSRATPFGLFAGVAPIRLDADATTVHWGERHRAAARPDSGWLDDLCTNLERVQPLLARLTVITNDLAFVRGNHLVVPYQRHTDTAPADVCVRYTRPVAAAVTLAGGRVVFGDLIAKLATDFPGREDKLREMLTELLARRVLLSSLRPPMSADDPLTHILQQLDEVEARSIPELATTIHTLETLQAQFARHNKTRDAAQQGALRASAVAGMAHVAETGPVPLAVDLHLDCQTSLPAAVARRAEQAAALLTQLDPYPHGDAPWRDYHSRFLERYGPGAVVPIRDLVSDAGLGFPAGYRGSRYQLPPPTMSDRDYRLLTLAQRAAMAGEIEVTLDDRILADLQPGEPRGVQRAPHLELGFQVHADSREAVDRDDFTLVVTAAFRSAGSTVGRFLHLLDRDDYLRFRDAYRALPTIDPDAMSVQLSSPPVLPRPENLARVAPLLRRHAHIGEHPIPAQQHIVLDDLAVTADAQRLQLVSLHRQCPVEFVALHSLEAVNVTHPMVRFLCEISHSRASACRPFSWGSASRLPFLPRIRHGNIVLSPARWNLTPADVAGSDATWQQWRDRFSGWADTVSLAGTVYVGGDDQRLCLHTWEDSHLRLLRAHLERHGHATLREAPDSAAFGWLDGHAHEIVVPLVSAEPRAWRPLPAAASGGPRTIRRTHGDAPGRSRWLQAKLYGHPERQTEILTRRISALNWCEAEKVSWWFLRYRDPEPHLRLRLSLPHPGMYGHAAQQVSEWTDELREAGLASHLVLDTYYPEIGRFGAGRAMTAAEHVFVADSQAAVAELTAAQLGVDLRAVTAASLVDLTVGLLGPHGMNWLVEHIDRGTIPPLPREAHRTAVGLFDIAGDASPALSSLPGGQAIADAWAARRLALAMYRPYLARPLEITTDDVVASLLHLHHIRVAGIDRPAEALTHRLARAVALSWTTLPRIKRILP
ncbi:lantibiotic dehydratase [Micromonospora sp. C51]|uniref:lantibiotic dehydratase n=1 Tax=Micromonospora sp. C51 TaxID=2824879 RepID=UPI001B39A972|nr:lantibiotic dehydratase [Micromonospora sp. C51]MBQ1047813.1 lantibiotic dehydratase [Micromonospora sp. C51]